MKKNTVNTVSDFGVERNIDLINRILAGKTIKRFFDPDRTKVFVEFDDGSQGMIESMLEGGDGDHFLSVMPPTEMSEELRVYRANVQGEPRREPETNSSAASSASAPPPCSCPSVQRGLDEPFDLVNVIFGDPQIGRTLVSDYTTKLVLSEQEYHQKLDELSRLLPPLVTDTQPSK